MTTNCPNCRCRDMRTKATPTRDLSDIVDRAAESFYEANRVARGHVGSVAWPEWSHLSDYERDDRREWMEPAVVATLAAADRVPNLDAQRVEGALNLAAIWETFADGVAADIEAALAVNPDANVARYVGSRDATRVAALELRGVLGL